MARAKRLLPPGNCLLTPDSMPKLRHEHKCQTASKYATIIKRLLAGTSITIITALLVIVCASRTIEPKHDYLTPTEVYIQ